MVGESGGANEKKAIAMLWGILEAKGIRNVREKGHEPGRKFFSRNVSLFRYSFPIYPRKSVPFVAFVFPCPIGCNWMFC